MFFQMCYGPEIEVIYETIRKVFSTLRLNLYKIRHRFFVVQDTEQLCLIQDVWVQKILMCLM
ncbi:hypothetical protein D5F53_24585 [Paenibacillus lautus]|uniref:Uncharacterized protein n=1 Tax=Paenibacillus lautus TaxID=1401 RepID=A0A385TV63_PAELA|nr:hypothetical protein D5F53_24585 [Paenibacillus lautus]